MKRTKILSVFEAFAGIGAQRRALDIVMPNNYKIVGSAEWYVPAIIGYQVIHNNLNKKNIDNKISRKNIIKYLQSISLSMNSKTLVNTSYWKRRNLNDLRIIYTAVKMSEREGNIFDIRSLFKRGLSNIDLLAYSFPCQDLSQQGSQKGMTKNKNTRSGLLWEIEKALDVTQKNELPKYLLMENVMAITNKRNKKELNSWMNKLKSLGYKNDLKVLNSSDFGSSQARRRAFMLSTLKYNVELPIGNEKPKSINKILSKEPRKKDFLIALAKYDISNFVKTKSNIRKARLEKYSTFNSEAYVYDPKYTGPTLTASGANSRIKIYKQGQIRKLSPIEAFRYMGFKNKDYKKVNELNLLNDTAMIFLCGNSISIEVFSKIMKKINEDLLKGIK